jgi:hypothetical protein
MGMIVKWLGVIVLSYIVYIVSFVWCGCNFVAINAGGFTASMALILALIVFFIGARVSVG